MRRRRPARIFDAFILIAAGAALLLSTLVLGWYTITIGSGTFVAGETLYPTAVQIWGTGSGTSYSDAAAYSAIGAGHTGGLYLAVTCLVVAGALVGFLAAYRIRRDADRSHRRLVSALVVLTVVLAFAAPVLVAVAQPDTVCADSIFVSTPLVAPPSNNSSAASLPCVGDVTTPGGQGSGYGHYSVGPAGPQGSFFGSSNETGEPLTWGPSIGWYIALAASALLAIGAVMFVYGRRATVPSQANPSPETNAPDPRRMR